MVADNVAKSTRQFAPIDDRDAVEECAQIVSKTFAEDPNNGFFCKDPRYYERRWYIIGLNVAYGHASEPCIYRLGDSVCMSYVKTDSAGSDEDGGASSNSLAPGYGEFAESNRPELVDVRADFVNYLDTWGGKKARFLQECGPFQYIALLATMPGSQSKGLGSVLLCEVLREADSAGRWTFLEATNERNVALYKRHGFYVVEEREWTHPSVPQHRARLILMARRPGASAASAAV